MDRLLYRVTQGPHAGLSPTTRAVQGALCGRQRATLGKEPQTTPHRHHLYTNTHAQQSCVSPAHSSHITHQGGRPQHHSSPLPASAAAAGGAAAPAAAAPSESPLLLRRELPLWLTRPVPDAAPPDTPPTPGGVAGTLPPPLPPPLLPLPTASSEPLLTALPLTAAAAAAVAAATVAASRLSLSLILSRAADRSAARSRSALSRSFLSFRPLLCWPLLLWGLWADEGVAGWGPEPWWWGAPRSPPPPPPPPPGPSWPPGDAPMGLGAGGGRTCMGPPGGGMPGCSITIGCTKGPRGPEGEVPGMYIIPPGIGTKPCGTMAYCGCIMMPGPIGVIMLPDAITIVPGGMWYTVDVGGMPGWLAGTGWGPPGPE